MCGTDESRLHFPVARTAIGSFLGGNVAEGAKIKKKLEPKKKRKNPKGYNFLHFLAGQYVSIRITSSHHTRGE